MAECTIQLSIDEFLKSYKTLLCKYNEYLEAEEVSLDDTNKIKDQIRELLEYYKDILVLEAYQDIEELDTLIAGINQKLVNGDFVGQDGINGSDGNDGYTPQKDVDYFDGKDGINGSDGNDGYTPIKGTDYFDGKDGQDGFSKGGFKNLIINGGFDVNQRGASSKTDTSKDTSGNEYSYDRWIYTDSTIKQRIEVLNYKPNTVYTLSGTNITTTQITSPASGTWTVDTGTNNPDNVQLEEGSVATPFEQRPYVLELSLCKRYYELLVDPLLSGACNNMGRPRLRASFFKKRVAPTVSLHSSSGFPAISDYYSADKVLTTKELYGVQTTIDTAVIGFYQNLFPSGRVVHGLQNNLLIELDAEL